LYGRRSQSEPLGELGTPGIKISKTKKKREWEHVGKRSKR